jgi:hypothetical protein
MTVEPTRLSPHVPTARFLGWSLRTYRNLLLLYPEELRRDFGEEMLDAFERDLSAECAARSIKGAVRVWRITLREAIRIGLPAWLRNPAVAVPALAAAVDIVSQSPLLIVAIRNHAFLVDTLFAIAIEAVVTFATSFVAVYRWKRHRLISLDLG